MVFAKTPAAASTLCQAWREKSQSTNNVEKVYLAMVREWPPFQEDDQTSGIIDLKMEPSPTERLKWRVAADTNNKGNGVRIGSGKPKPSQTEWKILQTNYPLPKWCKKIYSTVNGDSDHKEDNTGDNDKGNKCRNDAMMTGLVLELKPITGRTHQLRVHCAHVGSGIIGDSLYGKDQLSDTAVYNPSRSASLEKEEETGINLLLHAWKLSFPHPVSKKRLEVCSWPRWYPQPSN